LWTFVQVEGVEPTNNTAERSIRPGVLWRKGSFGTQSAEGSRFVESMLYHEYPLTGVPDRAAFPCDWPYAARRYNGSGPLSYNYQSRILRNLVT
jgi:hypothetical protein